MVVVENQIALFENWPTPERVSERNGDVSPIESRPFCSKPKSRATNSRPLPFGDSAWLSLCESKRECFYLGLTHDLIAASCAGLRKLGEPAAILAQLDAGRYAAPLKSACREEAHLQTA